jgi:hypothetical protein
MRPVVVFILFALVLVPTLLTLFQPNKPLVRRISWALWVFAAPVLAMVLITFVPQFDGKALHNPNLWALGKVVLMAMAFILPWVLFAASRERQ